MLYIVATPIGNLGEITYRAVETLKSVDAILCEDTRRTAILLRNYDIARPLVSYQKFSEREKCGYVIDLLKKGENLAIVSDAGIPLISDPGKILVDELIKENLEYTVVSGPCALVNAVGYIARVALQALYFFAAGNEREYQHGEYRRHKRVFRQVYLLSFNRDSLDRGVIQYFVERHLGVSRVFIKILPEFFTLVLNERVSDKIENILMLCDR